MRTADEVRISERSGLPQPEGLAKGNVLSAISPEPCGLRSTDKLPPKARRPLSVRSRPLFDFDLCFRRRNAPGLEAWSALPLVDESRPEQRPG